VANIWDKGLSFDQLMGLLEQALGPPPVGQAKPSTLSEMQAARPQAPTPPVNMAALLSQYGVPAGGGFIDPRAALANPSMIPPHSGNVVQWLGGALQDNKYEDLLAGLSAFNNIATTLDLQKRQKKQTEQLANLTPEQAQQLMWLSLMMGGLGGGR